MNLDGSVTDITKLPTFYKYFSINNAAQLTLPKFIMYISHDEIMGAFFKALGSSHIKGALPASDIYIEFYTPATTSQERFLQEQADSGIRVRFFYNDTVN